MYSVEVMFSMWLHVHSIISTLNMLGSCIQGDVRLANIAGYDRFEDFVLGEVQICLSSTFGSVCDTAWDNRAASVVCTQLGYSPYGNLSPIIEYINDCFVDL